VNEQRLFKVLSHALRFENRLSAASLRTGINPRPDHQGKIFDMIGMNKTDGSLGIAAQRPQVEHTTGTFHDLNAFEFVRNQVELFATDRTSERRLFHVAPVICRVSKKLRYIDAYT
jgi:hypothetical protein